MKWIKNGEITGGLPIKSWCEDVETGALDQALNLARHPMVFKHVALMPDCHVGYGMPIGGVIACVDAVIPNAVGVDIGCGMAAVQTDIPVGELGGLRTIRDLLNAVKQRVPVGEGRSHRSEQRWHGFNDFLETSGISEHDISAGRVPWVDSNSWALDHANLGSLGGGNHFIELQADENCFLWMMLHSGSRNLGTRIAAYYHQQAQQINQNSPLFCRDLAHLPLDSSLGQDYVRNMSFALAYAQENRSRMMNVFKEEFLRLFPHARFQTEVNIHHNYAAMEIHFGREVWVHRKGATSAREKEQGIIPGSMGTPSYIVLGKGNPESFQSCSHGAGRRMGRKAACEKLTLKTCDLAMDGIVYDRWSHYHGHGKSKSGLLDFSEAPQAYKDIDQVIAAELDLIVPIVKLRPLGVIKG